MMTEITVDKSPETAQKVKAVVFDLDGVLIHSAPCHNAAFEQVFAPFGITGFVYSRFAGWRTRDVAEVVFAEAGIPITPERLSEVAEEKSRLAREMIAVSQPLAEDCVAVLNHIRDSGFVLALASSGSPLSVAAFLDTTGTRSHFRSVLTGGDVRNAKPDPEIYSRTFAAIETAPENCLVVEDAVAGVVAAQSAGAPVVGISGTCSTLDLHQAGAIGVLESLRELPAWLQSYGQRN